MRILHKGIVGTRCKATAIVPDGYTLMNFTLKRQPFIEVSIQRSMLKT